MGGRAPCVCGSTTRQTKGDYDATDIPSPWPTREMTVEPWTSADIPRTQGEIRARLEELDAERERLLDSLVVLDIEPLPPLPRRGPYRASQRARESAALDRQMADRYRTGLTLDQVAAEFGLTRERVRQRIHRAEPDWATFRDQRREARAGGTQ